MVKEDKTLKETYENICNEYLKRFVKKHDFDYEDSWTDVGTVVIIGDFVINFQTIRYDIDNNVPKEKFLKWYFETERYTALGLNYLNYASFCKNAPEPYTQEEIEKIKIAKEKVDSAKEELEQIMATLKNNRQNNADTLY